MKNLFITCAILVILLSTACSDKKESKETSSKTSVDTQETVSSQNIDTNNQLSNTTTGNTAFQHPPLPQQNSIQARSKPSMNSGTAEQVFHSGGYTYINIKFNDQDVWLAGSQTPIKTGEKVYWTDHAVMNNFKSKSLDRTFDQIWFVSRFYNKNPNNIAAVNTLSGKVLSVKNAAGYSYIEVDNNGKTIWIAAPQTTIKANDNIQWNGPSLMRNFNSKSLNQTFKEIFFVASVQVSQ